MGNSKKNYFDILLSWSMTIFTGLLFAGLIVYLSIGMTIGIANWDKKGILILGFGAFGPMIAICLFITLVGGWRYWRYDAEGVSNGNLFHERKFSFQEIERVEIKTVVIGGYPFRTTMENLCFFKGKKMVMIPTECLSMEEEELLKQKITTTIESTL